MEEQNLDLSKRAEFIRPATTDLESFLPFGGENLQSDKQLFTNNPQSVPVTIENKKIPDQTSTLPQFLVKDNVTGFDPFSNNEIAKNPKDFSNALAAKLSKDLANLDSREHYSKTHMYDSSPTGAHKARYKAYGQSTYDKIGFNPEVNNEDLFNANTSIFDDYVRMATNSAFPMFVQGLFANPKSYSQIFQGNIGQDIDESEKYEEWNAIGYSSKGGLGAFFNNAINSVSYSAGIMFEAAAEYAAVGAIEGSIVGPEGTAVGAAAGGLVGAVKGLTAVPKALFDMGKYGGKMLTNLKNLEKFTEAKALFNTASKTTLNFVNPLNNTFQGIKAAKTGDNLTALARTAKTAGGFFRDVIGMNMALSEGRLEGGFVENNTYQKLYDEYWKREGKAPDIDTQVRMKKTAKIAGTQDTYKNAALVFYSNKLAFENLTSGKFMAGASGKVSQVGKEFDIIYKAAKEKGAQGVYELVDYNFKNGLKGIIQPKNFGKATLNYFKTNLVEGAQEVMQDVIAKATEDYYVGAFYDKSKANNDYSFATLDNAFAKQVSAEGFETFASGFVMGGLLRPFGGAIPRYAGVLYNKYMMDPAEYQEYIDNRKNYGQAVVNAMNNMQKANPAKLLKQRYVNLGVQSKINTILADEDASIKEKNDAIDASFLSDVLTTLKAGTFKTWLYNYEKMNEMSDKDFEETYNLKEGDGIKLKENLKEYISRAKKLQARYNYGRDEFGDKRLNLQNFQEGTPEYDKASIYNEALDTAVFNLTFLSETFDLNLQRVNKITQTLSKSKLFGRLPGTDIQNILEPNRLDSVINSLSEEINILKNTEDQYVLNTKIQNQIDEKETLLKKLTAFQETQIKWFQMEEINKIFETIKDESRKNGSSEAEAEAIAIEEIKNAYFQDDSIESADKKHFDAFNDLLIELAGSELNYTMGMREMGRNINSNTLYNYLKDIYLLTQENKNIVPYINLLTNRAGFYEHVEKNFQWMRNLWLNKQNYYKDIVNQSIKMKENNALLKSLADDNIFVDLDEFAEWVENPDILPSYFIDASQGAEKIIPKGSFLYDKYIEIFERVARMQQMAATEDSVDLDGQLQEAIDDLMNKKNNEIEAATVSFKSSIQQETGFSYADLEKKQNEINQNKIQKQNKNNESQIKQIKSFLESIKINDPNKVIDLIVEFRGSNILPYDNFNEDIIQDFINGITDKEYVIKNVIPYVNQYPESYGESRFIAGFRRFAVEQILDNYIKDLSEEEMEIVEDLTDPIKETQSWNDYQKALKKIEDKYEKLLEELVSEFTARGLSTKTKEEEDFVPVTTTTPWSEIENNHPELFKILESKFRDDVIIKMGISESNVNFEQIRNNWLETQSEIINKYNADIAAKNFIKKEKEKQFTPPNLKYYKFPKSFGLITEKTKIEPLVVVRDSLNSMLITGIKIDKNGNQTKLKKQTLDKIENDVNELNRVISWLRTYGEKPSFEKFQKYIDIFNTRIRNRKAEIEEVRDENGRLIERRIDGKTVKNRVTKEAEALAIEMTPGKKPFLYYALKPSKENIKDSEGNIVDTVERPPEIQTLYDSIMEDDSISSEDKLDNFLLAFKNFILRSKVNIWKNANNTKINKEKFELLEESLKQDFSKENVVKSIQELAYKHRTDAGILLDDLIKDFLKYDGITFKKIIKPEKMSQEAFDALFSTTTGKEGMITKFRDGYIDGNYIIVGASDLLFDKSLFENGLVGETDLIAINEDGDFEIIDVKALGSNSWSAFDADISLENLIEKLKSEGLSEEEISKNNDVVKLKNTVTNISQKLYYRIQQSIYANLFYNMTGIMPKRLSLFPIEVEVSNEGDIISAKMSSLLKQDFELADDELSKNSIKTLELEYVEESQRIVPLVKPNFADETFTDDKEEKPLIEEIDKSDLLKDNLNTKVAFSGQIGTLELINGNYVVNFGDTIQDLEYNQKPVTNGNLEFSLVGITPIRKIEKIGQIRKINGQRIEAKILGFNNAIINGVNYKLNRNENGEIVSMTYNSNDQEISELEEEKQYYQSEIDRLKSLPQTTQPTQPTQPTQAPGLPGPETTINIYAGTRENAELSNFAVRPFITGSFTDSDKNITFNTVEGAFQAAKLAYTSEELSWEEADAIQKQLQKATGPEAKAIGKKIKGLDTESWDYYSFDVMRTLLTESFEQNPDALAKLLATGNATLTHTQDKTKWGTEFPKLLMEVRDELRATQPTTAPVSDSDKTPIEGLNERLDAYGNAKLVLPSDFYEGERPKGRLNAFKSSISNVSDNLIVLGDLNLNEFDFISEQDKKRLDALRPLAEELRILNMNDISSNRRTVDVEKRYAQLTNQLANEFVDIVGKYVEQQLGKTITSSKPKLAALEGAKPAAAPVSDIEAEKQKITPSEFKEVERLAKFFLENPREPGVKGDARSKYPELFKAVTEIERRRQETLNDNKDNKPYTEKDFTDFNEEVNQDLLGKYQFDLNPDSSDEQDLVIVNTLQEGVDKINAKYDAELAALKTPVSDIEGFKNFVSTQPTENRVEPESISSENFIIRETANYRNQINRINRQIENLIKNNRKRTMRGGNFNDFIFALNSLPESFKLIKGKTKSDEELHLKEIEKLSVNPRVAIEIDQIFNTNYPEKLDILLEEGVSKITEDDLSEIYKWANNVLFELTILGSRLTIQNQLADDVDNQMNAMYELLNDLELIKLTKNGKIDRRSTKTSEKVFGPNKVQDRSSLSKDEEPISGQTKGVSGKNQQKKPTIDELKNIIGSSLISDDELLEGLLTEQTIEVTTDAQKLIDKMKNAKSLDDLSNAYLKALEYLNNNPTKINPTEIESINSEKTKELTVEPEFENLENNTYLLPKTAIFGHSRISPVIFKKKNNGTFFIEDVISGNKQDIKENELENFVRMTPEAIEELNNKVQLTEEEKEEFNKNLVAATEVLKNSTALDGVASQVEGGANTGGFLSALTNKNCNI